MIELQNLSKTFQSNGKDVKAVDSVSLTVNEGEICVFLGPSGCGKSTTLKMIKIGRASCRERVYVLV